ncbi:MAG: hypothetical protein QXI84_08350 [Thermofilaceae archaeon]
MRTLVYVLSAVAVVLGLLYLVSTLSNPSTDQLVFVRDLAGSLAAVVVGVVAPVLMRRFSTQQG